EDEKRGRPGADREQRQPDPGQRRRQLPQADEHRLWYGRYRDDPDDRAVDLDVGEFFPDRPDALGAGPFLWIDDAIFSEQMPSCRAEQQLRHGSRSIRSRTSVAQRDSKRLVGATVVRAEIRFDREPGILRELRPDVGGDGCGELRRWMVDGVTREPVG